MGMFDTLCDEHGEGWQTKAFECNLDMYRIGDTIPADCSASYQVAVLGEPRNGEFVDSFATIRENVLTAVGVERDPSLLLLNYFGTPAPDTDRVASAVDAQSETEREDA